jgi:IS4 transposase
MNVSRLLFRYVHLVTPRMHKVRRASFFAAIESAMSGGPLSVTGLGRNINNRAREKHRIKRIDRLCSNTRFQGEVKSIYHELALLTLGQLSRPVIHIDWSDMDGRKDHFLIRASLAAKGRSLTLYEEIHPQIHPLGTKEKPHTHHAFMVELKQLLPEDTIPIIVSDAGFRIPWFKLIKCLGWDYVGRVRNRTHCQKLIDDFADDPTDGNWFPIKSLYQFAGYKVKDLGLYFLGEKGQLMTRMIVLRRHAKGRADKTLTGDRNRRSGLSRASAEREKEPWLLATSLDESEVSAKKVARIYATRMQIEESFRDLKSGLKMNDCGTRKIKRLEVLLIIAAITQYLLYWLGLAVKEAGAHLQYQSNSIKNRNILSCQFIGLRAYKDRNLRLHKKHWIAAQITLKQLTQNPNATY